MHKVRQAETIEIEMATAVAPIDRAFGVLREDFLDTLGIAEEEASKWTIERCMASTNPTDVLCYRYRKLKDEREAITAPFLKRPLTSAP